MSFAERGSSAKSAYYDVFVSYARQDGWRDAEAVKALLDEHDIKAYLDHSEPPAPGSDLPRHISAKLSSARVFVPVLTNAYISATWARREFELAVANNKPVVPVLLHSRLTVPWLDEVNQWFDTNLFVVVIDGNERERTVASWQFVESVGPAVAIIAECDAVAAAGGTDAALAALEQLAAEHLVAGLQLTRVNAHKAYLLRLAGRRRDARKIIDAIPIRAHDPLPVVHRVLVTSAMLQMDMGEYDEARERLVNAAAVLSRAKSWQADDLERRKLLAEVTRETARSYLDEAYGGNDAVVSCQSLEVAWSIYLQALALVREDDDILSHAWIHENLGALVTLYASRSDRLARGSGQAIMELDYPAVSRYRANKEFLLSRSHAYFGDAQRLFQRWGDDIKRREGEAWTMYHRIQARLIKDGRGPEAVRVAIIDLTEVASLFDGIVEGQALAYADLFFLHRDIGEADAAARCGKRAIQLIEASEKHEKIAARIAAMLHAAEESVNGT